VSVLDLIIIYLWIFGMHVIHIRLALFFFFFFFGEEMCFCLPGKNPFVYIVNH
jgi:hypothetical protein